MQRYRGTVTPSQVRDFRGAMVGRADKGIIITTGGFTAAARAEAVRDGLGKSTSSTESLLSSGLKNSGWDSFLRRSTKSMIPSLKSIASSEDDKHYDSDGKFTGNLR